MSSRLAGIEAKIGRAQMHLEEFERLSQRYVDSHPYSIRDEEYLNDKGFMERSFTIDSVEVVPPDLSLIMGDCVQNLRAALDHLAWQLVLATGNTPTDNTKFPILDSGLTASGNPRRPGVSGGVNPKALAVIERSQPFKRTDGPKNHPLSILRDLSNIDKHRTVLFVGAFYSSFTWLGGRIVHYEGKPGETPDYRPTAYPKQPKPLRENAKVASFYVAGRTASLADTKTQLQLTSQMQFGEMERCEGQIVTDTLQQLLHTVQDVVVPNLKRFLI